MPEYIERESLLEDIKQYSHARIDNDAIEKMGFQFVEDMCSIQRIIEKQPAADVVEVVRCKDCMHSHWEQEPCHGKTEYYCTKLESKVDSHFYCGCGKRKEGADNG